MRVRPASLTDGRAVATTDASVEDLPKYHDFIRFLPKNEENIYSICLPLYQQGISLREIERQTAFAKTTILDTFRRAGLPRRKTKSSKKLSIKRQVMAKGGPTPYGYGYLEGRLAPDPKEYKIVLEIYRQRKKLLSYRGIAHYLNDQKITTRTGKKWTNEIIKRIIDRHEHALKKINVKIENDENCF
ncbi:MAG: recombinase family protein [Bdellovibrionales bacterium]|nr:recombinase family protein [Bdellovibrionales bacterium]